MHALFGTQRAISAGKSPNVTCGHADMRTCGPIIEMVRGQSYQDTHINNQFTHLTVF